MFTTNSADCAVLPNPFLRTIVLDPIEGSGGESESTPRRAPALRLVKKTAAAKHVQRTRETIENWIGHGYITGYRSDARTILVDLNEIERALLNNPKMRDGRKVYGDKSRIVSLPKRPVVIDE